MSHKSPFAGEANTVEAVGTTLDILAALQESDGAGVTELSTRLGRSKGTIHNHLSTLRQHDYVAKDDDDVYHLGFRFIEVSYRAKRRVKILGLVQEQIQKLAEESGELVLFKVAEHGFGVCVAMAEGENAVHTPVHVGYRSTLHDTAVGKAILAHFPPERVHDIVDRLGLPEKTHNTITERERLFDELEQVRRVGYATNRGETIDGLVGVGAPILDQNDVVAGGISIIGPESRLDENNDQERLAQEIRQSINVIEINSTSIAP